MPAHTIKHCTVVLQSYEFCDESSMTERAWALFPLGNSLFLSLIYAQYYSNHRLN